MEEEIKIFFASTEFYRRFEETVLRPIKEHHDLLIYYTLKFETKEIRLIFSKHNGIKGLSMRLTNRAYVEAIYWRDIDELSFILNRLPEIRWSNPLCSHSELQST